MRSFIIALVLFTLPAGCTWLHSGTPVANATDGTLNCIEVGATDAFKTAAPAILNLLLQFATTSGWQWSDVLAAFGGVEGVIKDGIVTATCIYYAVAVTCEQAAAGLMVPASATQPVNIVLMGRAFTPKVAADIANISRTYLGLRNRKIGKALPMRRG